MNADKCTSIDEEYDDVEDKGQGMCHNENFEKTRKHRIQVEVLMRNTMMLRTKDKECVTTRTLKRQGNIASKLKY